ncbi:unnamed protein product [Spirodela intermedia]|uniref:RING-type domain-containing protein n=2 Tax=Spirodela intermedia TaxID=51605 RepID=A0A7I8LB73_SPIIN|nr:unnamed protein product [Spirodela intermedia]CAA6670279.1 unnamed protein product [Spirodela intermedia]CAA7407331.1 unnamed protein product [Spirodela intermedia]
MDGELLEEYMEIASDYEHEPRTGGGEGYATPAPHHRRPPPPAKSIKGARFLVVVLQAVVMSSALLLFFLFAGIAAVVLLHLFVAGRSLRRRRRRPGGSVVVSKVGFGEGLSQEELKRLPASRFCENGESGAADCAVCLEALQDGERCRRLPRCRHVFHKACVDRWLVAAPACPVCRTGVREEAGGRRPSSSDGSQVQSVPVR